jgi:hypothetical protein
MRTTVILTGIAALASAAPAVQTVAASQENGQNGNWYAISMTPLASPSLTLISTFRHIGCDGKTDANSTNATCTYHGDAAQVPIHARSVIPPRSTAVASASNNKETGLYAIPIRPLARPSLTCISASSRISCEADLDDEYPEVACSFQYESSSQGAVPTHSRSAIYPRSVNAGQPPYTRPPYTSTPPGYTSSVYGKPKYTSTSSGFNDYYPPHSTPSYGSPEYTSAPYGPPTYTSSYSPYTSTSGYEKSAYTSCPPGETLDPHYSFCAPPRTTVNVQSLISSLHDLTRTKRGYTFTSHYVEPHTTSYYKKPTTTSYYEKPHTTSYYKPITTSYYEKPQSIYAPPAVPTLPPTCNFVEEECIDCNEYPEECNVRLSSISWLRPCTDTHHRLATSCSCAARRSNAPSTASATR